MKAVSEPTRPQYVHDELPVNPFTALRVSYGMLLGEEDFGVLMGNPRGKQMLHNAWLHGSGVVWGFPVDRTDDGQLRVGAGLALDSQGRELALHAPRCIDVLRWLAEANRRGSVMSGSEEARAEDGSVTVACLVARFRLCATRPVPAPADPCDLRRTATEPSRFVETVELELVPGDCPSPPSSGPYHRVRVLLGLDEVGSHDPAGDAAAEAIEEVAQRPPGKRAHHLLAAFRRLLALDVADLRPDAPEGEQCPGVFPGEDPAVPLARITVEDDGCGDPPDWDLDMTVRRGLIATSTIQELTCALTPLLLERAGRDAGGPRVVRDSVDWQDESTIVFRVTRPLLKGSLSRNPIAVSSLGAGGWVREDVERVIYDGERTVQVELHERPTHEHVRLLVRGTGLTPVTGTTGIPLAGLDDGEPSTADEGRDAVVRMQRRAR